MSYRRFPTVTSPFPVTALPPRPRGLAPLAPPAGPSSFPLVPPKSFIEKCAVRAGRNMAGPLKYGAAAPINSSAIGLPSRGDEAKRGGITFYPSCDLKRNPRTKIARVYLTVRGICIERECSSRTLIGASNVKKKIHIYDELHYRI